MEQQNTTQQGYAYSNQGYNSVNALQVRLDVTKLLDEIKLNLSGMREVYFEKDDGTIGSTIEKVGEEKANKTGVQSIMSFLSSHVNVQVVQGNYIDEEMYFLNIDDIEDALRFELVVNAPYWEIKDEHIMGIYHQIVKTISDYKTRLLFNKERDSYGETMRTVESNTVQGKSGFGLFKE